MQRVTQRGGGRGTRAGGWAWAVGVLLASSVACSLSDDLCVLQRLPPAEPGAGGLRPPHAPRTRPRLLRPLLRPQLQRLRGGLDSAAEAPPPGEAPPPAAPCAGGEDDASGQALPAGGDDEEEEDDLSLGAVSGGHASEETGGAGQGSAPAADDAAAEPGEQRAGRGAGDGEDAAGVDDVDVVECNFERIGDTNGVFYYLGQQQCAEPTDDAVAQALKLAAPAAPDGAGAQRRFRNPALTGRVQVKTGPQRVMCASKFKGRLASPEQVLDRSVVGDQFWFPDGWVAFDLGLYTSLQPSAYMMRNGGGLPRDKVMTGWVLEGATWVKGEYWREGDWQALDTHTNDTSFLDLALQAEADGTAAGYTHQTSPPMRVDHRTGKVQPAIHHELSFTWTPTPLGEMPHHTLAFHVDCQRSFRYLRMRQLTHVGHTHMDEPWYGHEDFYIQGLELYGKLSIQVLQSSVGPTKPCDKGMWMFGMDRQDPTKETKMWWARGAVDQCDADREVAYYKEKYIERLKELYVDDPPPRTPEEMQPPSYDRDFEDSTPSDSEVYPPVFVN